MINNKEIVLFVNDSIFAYYSSSKLINEYHHNIDYIVFSDSKSSKGSIFKIFKKVSFKYFVYRSSIHLFSKIFLRKKTVKHLADKYNINTYNITTKRELEDTVKAPKIGFAFNFDIIMRRALLSKFEIGVFNIHASKLPKDRGISPALWAFARGDDTIWSTIYKIDEGIDTGDICKQIQIKIDEKDSAFSAYKKVSIKSGEALSKLVVGLIKNKVNLVPQDKSAETNYCSWPDASFSNLISKSKRKLIRVSDILK